MAGDKIVSIDGNNATGDTINNNYVLILLVQRVLLLKLVFVAKVEKELWSSISHAM